MKKLFELLPIAWGVTSIVLMAIGAGMIYEPAGLIVAGLAMFINLHVRPEPKA